MIDIGVNLTNKRFAKDLGSVLQRARDAGVTVQVITGTHLAVSQQAHELAQQFPDLYCTAGVHPHHADDWRGDVASGIETLLQHEKVVAVGECGLDYNRNFSTPANQRDCFEHQLKIAVEQKKPVFLHEREAHDDFLSILKDYRQQIPAAVVHCFTGTRSEMQAYLQLDCHIGITGWICDERRGHHMHEYLSEIPDDRLLVETDAPYLLPRDMRPKPKNNRNEPAFLPHILRALAKIRRQDEQELMSLTSVNSRQFFQLD